MGLVFDMASLLAVDHFVYLPLPLSSVTKGERPTYLIFKTMCSHLVLCVFLYMSVLHHFMDRIMLEMGNLLMHNFKQVWGLLGKMWLYLFCSNLVEN